MDVRSFHTCFEARLLYCGCAEDVLVKNFVQVSRKHGTMHIILVTFGSCTFFLGDYSQEAASTFAVWAAGISCIKNEGLLDVLEAEK